MNRGAASVLFADALVVPAGFLTTVFLARMLGPGDYGVLTLAATVLFWVEWTIVPVFSQLTIKAVAQAGDWKPVSSYLLRVHLATGVAAGVLLFVLAPVLADAFHEPRVTLPLRILALDLPLFCLGLLHRSVLAGLGDFHRRAAAAASRHFFKLLLSVVLVWAGFSVTGAVLAIVGASVAELALGRFFVRPPLLDSTPRPLPGLFASAAPLLVGALCMRLFSCVDLFALKALGASAVEAGQYGAAQALANVPGFLAMALPTLFVGTVSRRLSAGETEEAGDQALSAVRLVIRLLPFAAVAAGSAQAITNLVYGGSYAPAAGPMAFLIVAVMGRVLVQVAASLLIAAGRSSLNLALMIPPLLLALGAYPFVIPAAGMVGAAAVHMAIALAAAVLAVAVLPRQWGLVRVLPTCARAFAVSGAAFYVSRIWSTDGAKLLIELLVLSASVPAAFWILGEFRRGEVKALRDEIFRRSGTAKNLVP